MKDAPPIKILISPFTIPYSKGSWTQRVDYFFSGNTDPDFYLLSKKPDNRRKPYSNQVYFREFPFIKRLRYFNLLAQLKKIIGTHKKVIVAVYDHVKIAREINGFISKNNYGNKVKHVFFQCGFSYEFDKNDADSFYDGIDTLVLLSMESYNYEKKNYETYPSKVMVLPNPVNYERINKSTEQESKELKTKLGIANKKIFLWLSADRKKKGLDIILNAWKEFVADPGKVLVVIGNNKERPLMEGVIFLGYMPNAEVYQYYDIADVYLFPTLCMEGFGLSVAEAAASGCFVIASDLGAVKEVIQHTKNKILVEEPNNENLWVQKIREAEVQIKASGYKREPDRSFLDYPKWKAGFEDIFNTVSKQF